MKPDCSLGSLAILVAALATGCGMRVTVPQASVAASPSVSTTRLMAADVAAADDAPRVGKPQHSHEDLAVEPGLDKAGGDDAMTESPHCHAGRPRGGFSGYK